jgi:alpha-L-rhamnosidase
VANTPNKLVQDQGDLWDSGKVDSDQSIHVLYAGTPLRSRMRCFWKVRVWDEAKNVSPWSSTGCWTMGLLMPEDWKAKWITPSRWFVPPGLRSEGFATRSSGTADVHTWADVNLGSIMPIDAVTLYPHKVDDFPLRFRIDTSESIDFTNARMIAGCTDKDCRLSGIGVQTFPASGIKGQFVRLTVLRVPEHKLPGDRFYARVRQMEVFSHGRNVAPMRPTREFGTSNGGGHATFLVDGMPSIGESNTCPPDACMTIMAPLLRKSFQLDRAVKRATLYVAALGMADITINGKKVSDDVLGPPFTDYTKRTMYVTYDVTPLLVRGENVIGAVLGNGFFSPPSNGFAGRHSGQGPPRLLAQIEIEFVDGSRETVGSDATWKWQRSEIWKNDTWYGYEEDRRLAKPGWDRPGYADSKWHPVAITESLGGSLRARIGPRVHVAAEQKPVRIQSNRAYFDVLTVGWPRLKVNGKAGQTITITGTCRSADLLLYTVPGMSFILAKNGPTVLEPRFFHCSGATELEVTGLSEPLTADSLTMQVAYADFEPTGSFVCSNAYFNQLHEIVRRTHLNYIVDHPMDSMREKEGWPEDVQSMFDSAAYLTNAATMYRKWWWDMADNQTEDGLIGSVLPVVGRQIHDWNCPWWSGIVAFLPMQHYLYYGDRRMLEDAYEPMRRYVDYVDRLASVGLCGNRPLDIPDPHQVLNLAAAKDRILLWEGANDWGNPFGLVPPAMMAMSGWYHCAATVSKTAKILGREADAAKYAAMAANIAHRYNALFFHPETGIYGDQRDCQTAMVLPLALGIVPADKRPLTHQRLIDAIHARKDHVGAGFVALTPLLQMLTQFGDSEVANRMVNQKDWPSWATLTHDGVLWESWKGQGAQMPSCGGAVGMWFYQSVLGIRPDPTGPGFKRFIIAPQPDPNTGLTWAKGSYDCIHGRIVSNWHMRGNRLVMDITIPGNTSATVYVPASNAAEVTEGGKPATEAEGVHFLGISHGQTSFHVESGHYTFAIMKLANDPERR